MININNRRYIGCKTKLIEEIYNSVPIYLKNKKNLIFADLFAGTGVVAYYFAQKGYKIILNDILYSNIVPYKAYFSDEKIDADKIEKYLNYFNNINKETLKENYFSDVYSNKYFSYNDCKKIGFIREYIENIKTELNKREYFYLLTSLMYSIDRIANTCGHYESFLKKTPSDIAFELEKLNIEEIRNTLIYNKDANLLASEIECDIAYIDPPYNARQYVNFYHVLENLARWNKPTEFEGNSMKFKRNELKSGYSRPKAPELMKDLIDKISAKCIIVSYNNTYNAKSVSSNNKISQVQLEDILKSKGKLSVNEVDFKFFNSGKTDFLNHKELIYVCEVNK